jgi:beta-N-acetylhexosaminidase
MIPATATLAAIVGIAGTTLASDEQALFRTHPPAGVILFGRNILDPEGLRLLIGALRRTLPPDAVLMVDQEGGRVARLRPPHWRSHPPAAAHGALFARDPAAGRRAAFLTGALIGLDCAAAGFDVVAAPVLDRRLPGAHGVIGDRAFACSPDAVAELGRAMAGGLLAAGVQPVGKHVPGHGRARVDSHLELPVVEAGDLAADWRPFAANADLPWMMTAHIRYPALDAEQPATLSRRILGEVVRGRIGFGGVLVSDDLAMQALSGTPAERALAALAAGCDVALYCSGALAPTADLLARCPPLSKAAAARLAAARASATAARERLDADTLARERDGLLT